LVLTQQQQQLFIEVFCETGKRPPPEVVPGLLSSLRREFLLAIGNRDYDEAHRIKGIQEQLAHNVDDEVRVSEAQEKKSQTLAERVSSVKQKLTELTETWNQRVNDAEIEKAARIEEMKARHERELDDFEGHWNESSTLQSFSRPSAQLIQLQKDYQLAVSAESSNLSDLKRRVEAQEKVETVEAERKIVTAMRTAHQNIRKRQQQEEKHLCMYWERQINTMRCEQKTEIQKAELCLKQLEGRRDACKKQRSNPTKGRAGGDTAPVTARTRGRVNVYRDVAPPEKLTLGPIVVGNLSREKEKDRKYKTGVNCRRAEL
jgi:hypothetical protein